jgi:hypothetical protein
MYLYLKSVLNGVFEIYNSKLYANGEMTCVMCNSWKMTFTLVPLAPLTMIASHNVVHSYVSAYNHYCHHTHNI